MAKIVECVCKFAGGISQNLQSLSPYSPTLNILFHKKGLDICCSFSNLISVLRAFTVREDLILRMMERKLIYNKSLIKRKFLIFNDYEMCITITLRTFFQEFSSGFSRDKVFLVSKKDCVAVQNTRIMENALNVRLNPLYSYLTLENVSEPKISQSIIYL